MVPPGWPRITFLTTSAPVYSSLNFKGKPHHLSQLGARELYPSMFSIRPGWGCHLHITSVSYPNAPALCIQMEAFILLLLGLHPSNAHLTGIPMFPAATVSQPGKVLFSRGGRTPIWLVSGRVGGLRAFTRLPAKEKFISARGGCATQRISQPCRESSCSTTVS